MSFFDVVFDSGNKGEPCEEITNSDRNECETDLDIEEDEVDEGEVVSCPECGTDFEIITINPIELKPVEEEDVDDDEEEEEAEDGDLS